MKIPKLYDGFRCLGTLYDATSCTVKEELNGEYTLTMVYPITGELIKSIKSRLMIVAAVNDKDPVQPFIIDRIRKSIGGSIIVDASHLSYELKGVPIDGFHGPSISMDSVVATFQNATNKFVSNDIFQFSTSFREAHRMLNIGPRSIKSCIFGKGGILDTYGLEISYNRGDVKFQRKRGTVSGITIRYAVNMTDFRQEESSLDIYDGGYAFYDRGDGSVMHTTPDEIIKLDPVLNGLTPRYKCFDLTNYFSAEPNQSDFNRIANSVITNSRIQLPDINVEANFAKVGGQGFENFENLCIGDDVLVEVDPLGISVSARCTATTYDALNSRIISYTIGNRKKNISDTVSDLVMGI